MHGNIPSDANAVARSSFSNLLVAWFDSTKQIGGGSRSGSAVERAARGAGNLLASMKIYQSLVAEQPVAPAAQVEFVPGDTSDAAQLVTHGILGKIVSNSFRMRRAWMAATIVCLFDAICSRVVGFSLSGYTPFLIVVFDLLVATAILRYLLRDPKLAITTEVVALWLTIASACNTLTYLSATMAFPLQDELLSKMDSTFGFRWLVLFQWVKQHHSVDQLLSTCYQSLAIELFLLGIWLSWVRHEQRILEFFWVLLWAALLTSALSALVPAAGAFVHYGLPDQAFWLHDLETLRRGSNLQFSLAEMTGIVTFPSFHTVLAILVIYAARGTGVVGRLFMAWNVLMLFSIPSIGSHYLVDMVGGGGVLVVSVGIVRGFARMAPGYVTTGTGRAVM